MVDNNPYFVFIYFVKKMMKVFWSCIFLLFFFSSCIEEFRLKPSRASVEKQLVIQGRIAAGDKSIIYVSYSQPLGEYKQAEKVLDAQVRIVGQNGYLGVLAEYDEENGCYWIDSKELPDDTMYALQVEVDGESYQSEYLSLLDTPEIKDVVYTEMMKMFPFEFRPKVIKAHRDIICGHTRRIGKLMLQLT